MKMLIRLIAVVYFILVSLPFAYALNEDRIIAIVNEDVITQSELDNNLDFMYMQMSKYLSVGELNEEFNKYKEQALSRMIEDKLILQEAKNQGMQAKEEKVNEMISGVKAQFNSQEEFNMFLASSGITLRDIKEKFSDDLLVKAIVDKEVRSKIEIHPREITDYYNNHKEEFHKSHGLEVDFIFTDIEKKEGFLHDFNECPDFNCLRNKYSEVLTRTTVYPGEFREDVEKALFSLEVNEWTSPIEIENNIYVFRLATKVAGYTKQLSEVQDGIYSKLMDEKTHKELVLWVEALKESAYIIIR